MKDGWKQIESEKKEEKVEGKGKESIRGQQSPTQQRGESKQPHIRWCDDIQLSQSLRHHKALLCCFIEHRIAQSVEGKRQRK